MKQPLYLIAYVIIVGIVLEVTTGWDEDALPIIFGVLAIAFLGWFFLLGMIVEGNKKKSGIDISKKGLKFGVEIFGGWFLYMGVLVAIGVVGAVLLLLYELVYGG